MESKFKEEKGAIRNLWEIEFGIEISVEQWKTYQADSFRISVATKLIYFQYRHLNKYLKTNVDLAKWQHDASSSCSFCCVTTETVRHLLWECQNIAPVWRAFIKWLNRKLGTHEQLTYELNTFCNF